MDRNRQYVLGGLLALFVVLSLVTLFEILNVVVFAITVAYVLYPLRRWLASRGLSRRLSSGLSTLVAFLVVVALIGPLVYAVYERRGEFIASLERIPDSIELAILEFSLVLEVEPLIDIAEEVVSDVAVAVALSAPRLVLELAVFSLLLYGILYRPASIRTAMYNLVPTAHHDILTRLHKSTKRTLYSIYIVQAMTAIVTFGIALVVFSAFGLPSAFWLAVFAGLLQFIPIAGPSILIVLLALNELLFGVTTRALLLLAVGLVFVSFVPDALIRTKLASRSGEIAGSLYFVGFVGGILTVGAIGVIAGPLVIALLVEVVRLISERNSVSRSTEAQTPEEPPNTAAVSGGGKQKSP